MSNVSRGGGVVESEKWGENKIQLQDGEGERQQEIGWGKEERRCKGLQQGD